MELKIEENSETIYLGDNLTVVKDKKSGASWITIPFDFMTDGSKGSLNIIKLAKTQWNPSDDIESVTIRYKN